MRQLLTGNYAATEGARLGRARVVAAYPITPQTQIVERAAEMAASGALDAEFIKVESEFSAMAVCIGAVASGTRAFTATSSQGLAYMHELLHWAAGGRYPVVMCNVNRAMAPPWNIWADHTDSMSQRDTGWLQLYCESNQDVLDFTLWAFRVGEQVRLPAMVNLDAFTLSHSATPVEMPAQEEVDAFLPPYAAEFRLDPDNPVSLGNLTTPVAYAGFRREMELAMDAARSALDATGEAYGAATGRRLERVRFYRCEDAELVLVLLGSVAGTAEEAVDALRDRGHAVGMAVVHAYRPFPADVFAALACRGLCRHWVVLDRSVSFGLGGQVWSEVGAVLATAERGVAQSARLTGLVGGLGGVDITPVMLERALLRAMEGKAGRIEWLH